MVQKFQIWEVFLRETKKFKKLQTICCFKTIFTDVDKLAEYVQKRFAAARIEPGDVRRARTNFLGANIFS